MTDAPDISVMAAPRLRRGWQLFLFFTSALVLTGVISMLFADLLWRTGWSASRTVLLVLFIILFLLTAPAACTAFMDFLSVSSAHAAA